MKITVLGCGALGQLWLTALCKQGHEVQGWLRVPQPFCSVNLIVEEDGTVFNESLTANDPEFLAAKRPSAGDAESLAGFRRGKRPCTGAFSRDAHTAAAQRHGDPGRAEKRCRSPC